MGRYRLERRGHGPCQSTILVFNIEQQGNQKKLSHDDLYACQHMNCVPPAPSHSQKMVGSFPFHTEIWSYKSKLFNKSLYMNFQQTCNHWHTKPVHSMFCIIYHTLLLFQNMNFTVIHCIIISSVIKNCCSAGESTLHHRRMARLLIHFVQL